ncbi:MAG: hypothetical protein LBI05_08430 [Planctomycetaceae bacterium]|jgi:hypothetical protein|nr:hypothetical protein [Planctomycetaceae bacterium]
MKRKRRGFTIKIKVPKRTGHSPRPTGAGVHEDSRTKRNRTRERQVQKAVNDK